jgi:hypothetical protein
LTKYDETIGGQVAVKFNFWQRRKQTMHDDASLTEKEKERTSLVAEAAGIVRAAAARGRGLTVNEDSQVLALMTRVRVLDQEIIHLTRHPGGRA